MFSPEEFMNTTVEGEFETKRTLVPVGEYTAMIESLEAKTVGDDNKPILSVKYKLVNTGDEETDGRFVYDTVWLDVDDRGSLMRGPDKNLKLGQILEAVGLNGKPWSPGMLQGQVIMIQVNQSLNKRTNEDENRVGRIAKAA